MLCGHFFFKKKLTIFLSISINQPFVSSNNETQTYIIGVLGNGIEINISE